MFKIKLYKSQAEKAFISAGALIALSALAVVVVGAVVWSRKIPVAPLVMPKSNTLAPSNQSQEDKKLESWTACNRTSDCAVIAHPCCPNSHTFAANKSIAGLTAVNSPQCQPLPFICTSEMQKFPLDTPVECIDNKCVISSVSSDQSNEVSNPTERILPLVSPYNYERKYPTTSYQTNQFKCQDDADCYDAQGNPIGMCNVPCQNKAICQEGTCIRPMINRPGIQ